MNNKIELINELKRLVEYRSRFARSNPLLANYKDAEDWGAIERESVTFFNDDSESERLSQEMQQKLNEAKTLRLALIDRTVRALTEQLLKGE